MQNKASVIYQDNHIIVACKPYGVLSEHDDKKPNMPALLREETGCEELYTVHRLDRTTQGLMVYAKTREAAKRLSDLIAKGGLEKTYLAVVEGAFESGSDVPSTGELVDLLYFDRRRNKSYVVKRERRGVKEARLRYELLKMREHEGQKLSLLRIRLLTGRTHQIRVQFASRHMPLVGDRRYGSRVNSEQIMLCASQLRFVHPFTGEEMSFSYQPNDGCFTIFNDT